MAYNKVNVPRALMGFDGGDSSTKEILFRYTSYFNSQDQAATGNSGVYYFRTDQDFIENAASSGSPVMKVESVSLYALPAFGLDTTSSPVMVLFGVPVRSMDGTFIRNAAQQSTLLLPTSVSQWVKVGGWTADKLFEDSTLQPATVSNTTFSFAALFQWAAVNPDTFDVLPAVIGSGVQFKLVVTVSQTLNVSQNVNAWIEYAAAPDWDSILTTAPTTENYPSQIEALKLSSAL
jgi:hypothetical protein